MNKFKLITAIGFTVIIVSCSGEYNNESNTEIPKCEEHTVNPHNLPLDPDTPFHGQVTDDALSPAICKN